MKHPLLYIAEMLFCSGAFMVLWRTVLAGRITFTASRVFLLLSVAAAAAIPMFEIPLYPAQSVYYEVPLFTVDEPAPTAGLAGDMATAGSVANREIDWTLIAKIIYLSVAILALAKTAAGCCKVMMLRRRCRIARFDGYTIAHSDEITSPFSFMGTVFMPVDTPQEHFRQILYHELSHIRHRHSLERAAMEVMRSVLWFNPFVWITARALAEVHEWEADRDVLDAGYDLKQYRITIFRQLFGYNPDITSGLAHSNSITKKRFIMMTRKCGGKLSSLRLAAAATLSAGLVLAFGCTTRAIATTSEPADEQKPIYSIDLSGLTCTVDGEQSDLDAIAALLASTTDSVRVSGAISISADDDTPYGRILEIKNLLRKNKFFKVNYLSSNGTAVSRIMPPLPEHGTDKVKVLPAEDILPYSKVYISIVGENGAAQYETRRRQLLDEAAKNNGSGVMLWMIAPSSPKKHLEDMIEAHKQWMKSEIKEMDEAQRSYVELPDKSHRAAAYPRAAISLVIDNDASYGNFVAVSDALYNLYAELREEKAQEIFHKSLTQLSDEELACIYKIVPMMIQEVSAQS